jgi:N-acetyl-anhydromuramyl-L-alanine amidase AmpD
MALWDNDMFGHSLQRAATLIGQEPEVLKRDPVQNIRGASALLSSLHRSAKIPERIAPSLESWADAIASYTGIQQPDLALGHAYEVLTRLSRGIKTGSIDVPAQPVALEGVRKRVLSLAIAAAPLSDPQKTTATPDYPLARWVPGKAGYYYAEGDGYGKQFVVIHDMEGYYASVLSYFQTLNDGRQVSIHYCVNGLQDSPSDYPPGDVAQMVEERFYAWHAACLNRYSIGIEHEGFASNPAWYTPEMYLASGKLVKYLCEKYGIPKDRNHIIAHQEWQNGAWVQWAVNNGFPSTFGTCNSHTDPGAFWDWEFLLQIVKDDQTPPRVTSAPPSSLQFVDMRISVTFSQRMEPTATAAALNIVPSVSGSVSWTNNGRTMHFQPSSYLSFDTEYHVTVDSSARNYLDRGLDGNGDGTAGDPFDFVFRTVLRDTIVPSVTGTYPVEGASAISRSPEFIVTFSEQIDQATLAEGFSLETSGGAPLPASRACGFARRRNWRRHRRTVWSFYQPCATSAATTSAKRHRRCSRRSRPPSSTEP